MTDRDDIDMQAWTGNAFAGEPRPGRLGDTLAEDLVRGHAALSRRRRRLAAGASGLTVAAVASVIAVAPALAPSEWTDGGDTSRPADGNDVVDRSAIDVPPDDGLPHYQQRRLLYEVAWGHLDRSGEQLRWEGSVGTSNGYTVGADFGWQVPGEDGLGLVHVGIGSSAMHDSELRGEALCGQRGTYECEPRQLPDGSTAWVGQGDDLLGVAYRQPDGDGVWLVVDPKFPYATHAEPVSSVDITVEDALDFVADDRLRYLE
jgi:hypothetical protein